MKKPAFFLSITILLAAVFALGMQMTSSQTATKATAQTAVEDNVARQVAQQRVCDGLKLVQSKMRQIEESLSTVTKTEQELEAATARLTKEGLIPHSEIKTIGQAAAPAGTGLVPAERIRMLGQIDGQLRGVKNDLTKARGILQAQIGDLRKSWGVLEQYMKRLAGLKPASVPAPALSCVSQEVTRTNNELATLGSRASSLQARIEDVREAIDREFGQGPCGKDCAKNDCQSCCAWRYKVPPGAPENSIEAAEQRMCKIRCQAAQAACAFQDFDNNTNDLFSLMMDLIKAVSEAQTSGIKKMRF
jgi:prefoldin subunit 5